MRLFAGFASAVLALAIGFVASEAFAADPFLVGIISPQSGPFASVGTRQTAAIQWWAKDVNGKGGIKGRQVELKICDDQGKPEVASTCGRDLIAGGVSFLLDTSIAGAIRAVMPLVDQGPVMIVVSPIVNPAPKSFVFQVSPTDLEITRGLLNYMQANKAKKLAMIASTDATGEVGVDDAQKIFRPAGVDLALARIDLRANDASIQLANVVQDNPPLLYSAYSGGGAATVVKSFANLGLTLPLVISNANLNESFMALIKDDMPRRLMGLGLNSLVPEFVTSPEEKARIDYFKKSFEAGNKETVDSLTHQGLMLADCSDAILRNVDDLKNPAAIRSFLESTVVHSVSTIHFSPTNHIGLGAEAVGVLEWKKDHWSKADPL